MISAILLLHPLHFITTLVLPSLLSSFHNRTFPFESHVLVINIILWFLVIPGFDDSMNPVFQFSAQAPGICILTFHFLHTLHPSCITTITWSTTINSKHFLSLCCLFPCLLTLPYLLPHPNSTSFFCAKFGTS